MKIIRRLFLEGAPLFCVILLASCSLVPEAFRNAQEDAAAVPAGEILVPVVNGSITSKISFVGNLRYNQSADLNWKTDGVIGKVYVKVGDRVKKGDILAELAADSLESSVILAEKNMIEQQEKLEDVKNSEAGRMQAYVDLNTKEKALHDAKIAQEVLYYPRATREEMEIAWDKFALAHLNFNYAKQDYDFLVSKNESWEGYEPEIWIGSTKVFGGDSRSARERKFEDYVNTYNTLVTTYENYVWTSGRPTDTEYAIAQGNVAVAQMEYDKALQEYLSYSKFPRDKDVQAVELSLESARVVYESRFIMAPFDGIVTSVSAVESYYVKKGAAAFRVDDMSRIYIPLSVSELDIASLAENTRVDIVVDANFGKTYTGHVTSIAESSTVSENTTAFSVMVEIDDPDESLLAGMTGEASLGLREKKDVLLIPESAVSYISGNPCVTVVKGTERNTLEISLGIVSDGISEVTSKNLHAGDLLSADSVAAAVLTRLGLEPSDYLIPSGQRPARPQFLPSGTAPALTPTGTAAEKREDAAQPVPAETETPAAVSGTAEKPSPAPAKNTAQPQFTPTAAEPALIPTGTAEKPSPVPAKNTAQPRFTPTAAEPALIPTGTAEVPSLDPDKKPAPEDGRFPLPPDDSGRPERGGDGNFRKPPDGPRPDGNGMGHGPAQRPAIKETPTAVVTVSGEKG